MALDAALAAQLKGYLENLRHDLVLVSHTDDGPKSTELLGLLGEISTLSPRVSSRPAQGSDAADLGLDRVPSFAIVRAGAPAAPRTTPIHVVFAGIPLGHEFTSLVLALLHVGGHPSREAEDLLEQAASLSGEHHFETFFSLSCQNCPDVVQALNLMAVLNPGISHTAIDGGVFPDEAERRGVLSVPMVFRDGEPFTSGRKTLADLVALVDAASGGDAAARAADELTAREPFDVLVLGGGPAGASAAVYAARKGIRTGLVAERFGGQVLDTMSIENLVSVPHTEGPKLAADLERHVREYEVDLMLGQRVEAVRPAGVAAPDGSVEADLHTVLLENGATLRSRTLVLATGARWRTLGVPGEDEYRTRGVTFCPHCDGPLFKGKRVAVVGGGNSGVEAAIDLAGVVGHVTLVEFLDELKADAVLQRKLRSLPNVEILLGTRTTEIVGDGAKVVGLRHMARAGGDESLLDLEGVFIQIGLLPSTEFLRGAVELSPHGEVVIDAAGRTSVPGIFGAGDCTTDPYKQIVVALGSGSTAALSAFDHLIRVTAPADVDA